MLAKGIPLKKIKIEKDKKEKDKKCNKNEDIVEIIDLTEQNDSQSNEEIKQNNQKKELSDVDFSLEMYRSLGPKRRKGYNYVSKRQLLVSEETIPWWASKPHILDKQLRSQDDPEYDATTLYIPEDEKKKLSPNLRQFWEFKSRNFDKLILFRMNQHYELFYDDAIIASKLLDLSWDHRRLSVSFHERHLEENCTKLLEVCSKVAVIEQTETLDEMRARVRGIPYNPNLYVVHRMIGQILTKGTWNGNYKDYDSKYLLVLNKKEKNIGFCLLESSVLEVSYGWICINSEMNQLRTLLWQTNPVEIIYNIECEEYKKIFLTLPRRPDLTLLKQIWRDFDSSSFIPKQINNDLVVETAKGLFFYLKQVLVLDTMQSNLIFKELPICFNNKNIMGLDYQSLSHLEIFFTNSYSKLTRKGSLYEFIDKTSSPYGHRLLAKWLAAPLNDFIEINNRLEAIEDLHTLSDLRDSFQNKLNSLQDIERTFVSMFKYLKKIDFVKHDEIPSSKMKILKELFNSLKIAESLITEFQEKSDFIQSKYLIRLINYEQLEGFLPHSNKIIQNSLEWIQWDGDRPIPKIGFFKEYDDVKLKIKKIDEQMQNIINHFRKQFSDPSIKFYHVKTPYQIEINEIFVRGIKKPENLELVSCGPYVERFHTKEIKDNIEMIDRLEREANKHLFAFLKKIYSYFMENSFLWQQIIQILSELDCLCSLSKLSFDQAFNYPMSKPLFINSTVPYLKIQNLVHPCLINIGVKFNPISINFNSKNLDSPEIILLTGPNMGGKSTTLRTIGVVAVLAHIGCYVPASFCELSPIEHVYTRMGGDHNLYEGKSSFFIELEETKNIISNSNEKSLILIDELGKGTSTYDGVAIAHSVLKYIMEEIRCRAIFTTHYHSLPKEFSLHKQMNIFHMSFHVEQDSNHVIFEYQIKEGEADRSYGILLAKRIFERAAVGQEIINSALEICSEFENCDEKIEEIFKIF